MRDLIIDKNTDRFQYYDTVRRLSNNEINAALRNLVEEQRLQAQLSHYKNEIKSNNFKQEREIFKNQSLIKKLQANTGTAVSERQIKSAKSNRSKLRDGKSSIKCHPQSASKPLNSENHFMQLICESSVSFPNGLRNRTPNTNETKHTVRDNMTGTSFNFNDIYEISDSDDSDQEEFIGSILETGTILGTIKPKEQKQHLNKKHDIRPMTTNIINHVNGDIEKSRMKRESLFDCKTAPISRKKNGFKIDVQEDSNLTAWLKYKKDKLRDTRKGKTDVVFEDENLERKYFDVLYKKNQIPRHSPEEISVMKKRDPIFAKRHTQFINAKRNGKPANYDDNDINTKLFFPKWQIKKQRQEMEEEKPSGIQILREHNQKNHQFINEKVKLFSKKFPSQPLKNFL